MRPFLKTKFLRIRIYGEVERIWKKLQGGDHDQNIVYEKLYISNLKVKPGQWWRMPLILALGRQAEASSFQ